MNSTLTRKCLRKLLVAIVDPLTVLLQVTQVAVIFCPSKLTKLKYLFDRKIKGRDEREELEAISEFIINLEANAD